MKTKHDGDCTIYACLCNGSPEDGICTCGYGHQLIYDGDWSEMYSEELQQKMENEIIITCDRKTWESFLNWHEDED